MQVSWFPSDGSAEIIFTVPTYTSIIPDIFGRIPVEHITTVGPGQDGVAVLNSTLAVRDSLNISFTLKTTTLAEMATARRTLTRAFSVSKDLATGNPVPGTLKIIGDDDETFYIDCLITSGFPTFPMDSGSCSPMIEGLAEYWQKVQISLTAHSPWWYQAEESNRYVPWTGMTIPDEIPAEGQDIGEYSDGNTIDNIGDLPVPIKLQINGPMVNPLFTNETTGEFISLTKTLTSGQQLYIDTAYGNITCEIRDATTRALIEDAFQYASVDTTWFWLQPGENTVQFESDDSNDGGGMLVYWTPRYSGI